MRQGAGSWHPSIRARIAILRALAGISFGIRASIGIHARSSAYLFHSGLTPPTYRLRDVASALPLSATTTQLNSIQRGSPSGAIHSGQFFVDTRRGGREDSSTKLGLTSSLHAMLGSNNSERQSAFLDN